MSTCPNCTYWQAQVRSEKKRADDNMRLAAEKASTIDVLKKELEEALTRAEFFRSALGQIRSGISENVNDAFWCSEFAMQTSQKALASE